MSEILSVVGSFFNQFNWVDGIVILIAVFYIIEGYGTGFVSGIFDIVSFLFSFAAALKLYKFFGDLTTRITHIPQAFTHIIAFALIAILVELGLRMLQGTITRVLRKIQFIEDIGIAKANRILGVIPGLFSGLVLIAFLLTVLVVLPVGEPIKQAIGSSKLGSPLVAYAQDFEKGLTSLFGQQANDLLTFFTVEPQANSSISLNFTVSNGTIDTQAESQMLTMVNAERAKAGVAPLTSDAALQQLARAHSQDMLARGYFSHYTPEGKSPFDRMNDAGIAYTYAGENLAFSANVELAMQGLMNSPGHRANILSPNFHKIGIGIIDAGIYGEMFSQEFTD